MELLEVLKIIFLGVVEGITEWLPISSTGHMILVDEFIKLSSSPEFKEMFFVVVQLGAIIAVVILYWEKLFPFSFRGGVKIKMDIMRVWFKIVVASIPVAVIGLLFEDKIDELFYNPWVVACMLILYGVLFIIVENRNMGKKPKVNDINSLTYRLAFFIGLFQALAVIPGTSRSGVTIIGSMMLGVSRTLSAEFSFFLAIPAMFGASAIKFIKFLGLGFTYGELAYLVIGMATAFIVSVVAIKFMMTYIKSKDFKAFGIYRIVLGVVVIIYFMMNG